MKKLTDKQQWFLNLLCELYKADNVYYWTPTELGASYKRRTGKGSGHSSAASPVLLKLRDMGLIERNIKGHYRFI